MENVIDQIGQNIVGSMPHLAGALAFGLGAREIAAREMAEWVQSIKSRK
ncbi:MAG TPA: hypothetical protein VK208_13455 [Pyrinomonadaceae bacterium]|nr:hypothetical protein [Pyrinomonadaceae bacterium]